MTVHEDELGYLKWRKRMRQAVQSAKDNARPDLAHTIKANMRDFPWMRPSIAVALAKQNITGQQAYRVAVADLYWQVENTDRFGTRTYDSPRDRLQAWDDELKGILKSDRKARDVGASSSDAFDPSVYERASRFGGASIEDVRAMRRTVRAAMTSNDPMTMNSVLASLSQQSKVGEDPFDANKSRVNLAAPPVLAGKVIKGLWDWSAAQQQNNPAGTPIMPPLAVDSGGSVHASGSSRTAAAAAGQGFRGIVRNTAVALDAGWQGLAGVERGVAGFASDAGTALGVEGSFNPNNAGRAPGIAQGNTGLNPLSAATGTGPYSRDPNGLSGLNPYAVLEQTQGGQALLALVKGQRVDTGSGWLPDPESETGKAQAEAARKYSPQLFNGHAWTIGRQTANVLSEPDSVAWTIISGLVDGTQAFVADPSNFALARLGEVNRARKVFDLTEAGDAVSRVRKIEAALDSESTWRVGERVFNSEDEARTAARELVASQVDSANQRVSELRKELRDLRKGADGKLRSRGEMTVDELARADAIEAEMRDAARVSDSPESLIDKNVVAPSSERRAQVLEEAGVTNGRTPVVRGRNPITWLYSKTAEPVIKGLAETNDPFTIYWALDGRVPIQSPTGQNLLEALADAKTESEVRLILSHELGTSIDRIPSWKGGINVGPSGLFGRYGMDMPGRILTPGSPDANAKTLFETFAIAGVPVEEQRRIFNQMVRAHGRGDEYAWVDSAFDAIGAQLKAAGVPEKEVDDFLRFNRKEWDRSSQYGVNADTGEDMPLRLRVGGEKGRPVGALEIPDDVIELLGPRVETERLNAKIVLPDPRKLRRLVSEHGFNKLYDSMLWKGAVGGADKFYDVWKTVVLLRGAWPVRVIGDEMLRIAATGMSPFLHPLSYAAWVIGDPRDGEWLNRLEKLGKKPTEEAILEARDYRTSRMSDLLDEGMDHKEALKIVNDEMPDPSNFGKRWAAKARRTKTKVGRGMTGITGATFDLNDYFGEALTSRLLANSGDTPRRMYLSHFDVVDRASDSWTRGVAEEMYRLYSSQITRRALRYDTEEEFLDALWNEPWGEYVRNQVAVGRRGDDAESWRKILTNREWSDAYGRAVKEHIDNFIGAERGGNPVMEHALRNGYITTPDGDQIPLSYAGHPNPEVEDYIAQWRDAGAGPDNVKVQRAYLPKVANAKDEDMAAFDLGISKLFDALMTKPSNYLTRSPTFRQAYWDEAEKLIPSMDGKAQQVLLKNLDKANLPEDQAARIRAAIESSGSGHLNAARADEILKRRSLDYTRNLLYDLHKRNQFFDAARLVFPFGEAWKEVLQTWARILTENPNVVRRVQQGIEGARAAEIDPITGLPAIEGQGKGLWRWDPVTGQYVFTYPGSAWMSQVGVDLPIIGHVGADMPIPVPMHGPVKSLNMAFAGLPGFGPGVSVAASELIPDKPGFDFIKKMIFPYGEPEGDSFWDKLSSTTKPTWFRNFERAQKSPATDRIYGNMVFDVMAVLASTGDYKISGVKKSPYELVRLYNDAKDKAKWLSYLRGMGAFSLPASPGFDFYVNKDWSAPGKPELLMLQKLRDDYVDKRQEFYEKGVPDASDRAFQWFLKQYGADNVFATQSKSYPNVAGLEYTQEMHDWERNHPEVVQLLPKTWALFAPAGGEFKIETYNQFIKNEYTTPLKPMQAATEAMSRLGNHVYDWQTSQLSDRLSVRDQQVEKRRIADRTEREYPGWTRGYAGNEQNAAQIVELKLASQDPKLKQTELGEALGLYFDAREQANAEAVKKTKRSTTATTSKETKRIREKFLDYVDGLIASYPSFQRAWDRVLSREWEETD